jgi:hypothetical protein
MEVDITGLTIRQRVSTPMHGEYEAELVLVPMHVYLPDGRTVQILPGNDARAELPPGGEVIWHARMGMTPQEVALAGAEPVDGSELAGQQRRAAEAAVKGKP